MGATILKIDTSTKKPLSEKQKAFIKKLLAAPTMSDEQYREYKKNIKLLSKWRS